MSPRERLWPGCSIRLEKEAQHVQKRGDFKKWSAQYERRNNGSSPTSPELPRVNPEAYYQAGDGTLVKGCELAEGILPVNLQKTTPFFKEQPPSFWERLKKGWRLFLRRAKP